ncbi:MAG: hypothetical protein AAGU11_01490, partial [Syntrophobacteraceae bacterium]
YVSGGGFRPIIRQECFSPPCLRISFEGWIYSTFSDNIINLSCSFHVADRANELIICAQE